MPSPSGEGSIRSWPKLWDSTGSGLPAQRRCITCSGGWTWMPLKRPERRAHCVGSLCEEGEAIAVDGKALRGIHGDELPGGQVGGGLRTPQRLGPGSKRG